MRRIACWFAPLLVGVLVGCGGDSNDGNGPTPPKEEIPDAPAAIVAGSEPSASPDGTRLAFTTPTGGIAILTLATGAVEAFWSGGSDPDWNRAGTLIAIGGGGVGVVNVATKALVKGFQIDGTDDDPDWSPSGAEIALTNRSPDGIAILAYPGGTLSNVACSDPDGSGCAGEGPSWSPDGAWIAFEDGTQLLKVRRGGGQAVAVVDGQVPDVTEPAWSPDGKYIAFVVPTAEGGAEIWVVSADGAAQGLWRVTNDPASYKSHPTWSPGSGIIYYEQNDVIWKVGFRPQ